MGYSSYSQEVYTYFTEKEHELIESWLKSHDYTWSQNTVCGSCCGMYEDEYWVNGIGGEWRSGDKESFEQYCKENNIEASVDGHTVSARSED